MQREQQTQEVCTQALPLPPPTDGNATGSAIADYVEEKKLLAGSDMDPREACSWVLCYLVRAGVLKAKESK